MRTAVGGSRPSLWVLFRFISTFYSPKQVVESRISVVLNNNEHNITMSEVTSKRAQPGQF